jgi:hypothetical protein
MVPVRDSEILTSLYHGGTVTLPTPDSKLVETTAAMLRYTSASSVRPQMLATWQAATQVSAPGRR